MTAADLGLASQAGRQAGSCYCVLSMLLEPGIPLCSWTGPVTSLKTGRDHTEKEGRFLFLREGGT